MATAAPHATRHTITRGATSYDVHVLSLGGKSAYVWVGHAGAAPVFGALAAAVPPHARGGEPSVANLLGDSSPFEDVAGRLSRRLGRLVLLATGLGSTDAAAAGGGGRGAGGTAGEDDDDDGAGGLVTGDTAWLENTLAGLLAGDGAAAADTL